MKDKKLWSGRFTKSTRPEVDLYTASITFDSELVYEDILGSLAHTDMLANCGILTSNEAEAIKAGLKNIALAVSENKVNFSLDDEDIHMNIERLLTENIGEVAGKLHIARSRNDQVALDIHLYLRKQIIAVIKALHQLQTTLLQLAKEHRYTILPGYTHLQRAQPIYLAQYWLTYFSMLQRDVTRLQDCWLRVNYSPLGACALAGTTLPTNRQHVADLLGFDGIYINTLDAVSDRDFIIEFISACALIMLHISRLSEELILWASQEFNFIIFDDAYSTGSSIMPQKKNPDVAELGRGKSARVYGALITLLTLIKGLPLAYNKDLQEDKEPLFDVIKTVKDTLNIYSPLLATLKINSAIMRAATDDGYANATALAEYLVKIGMTFRAAHEVVGKMVNACIQKSCRLEEMTLAEMQQFYPGITDEIYQVLIIENVVAACDTGNQKKQSLLEQEYHAHEQQVKETSMWLHDKSELLKKVYEKQGVPLHE